jgi:hypothetical protein
MPVIGRLDSQVKDVLIEPVGRRRHRGERDGRAPRDATDDTRTPATSGDARGDGGDASDDSREDIRRDEQLPIWLL